MKDVRRTAESDSRSRNHATRPQSRDGRVLPPSRIMGEAPRVKGGGGEPVECPGTAESSEHPELPSRIFFPALDDCSARDGGGGGQKETMVLKQWTRKYSISVEKS